jgi:GNAT superfamily N-acetyltransferase
MPDLIQLTDCSDVTPALREGLITCWTEVVDGDGAAGLPFPPVPVGDVPSVLDALVARLHPDRERLLIARSGSALAGWVALSRDPNPLIARWGRVDHLQTRPSHRKRGIATALMSDLHRIARDEMGLERLHLAARGGQGLEHFYARLGWREAGRWTRPSCQDRSSAEPSSTTQRPSTFRPGASGSGASTSGSGASTFGSGASTSGARPSTSGPSTSTVKASTSTAGLWQVPPSARGPSPAGPPDEVLMVLSPL